MTTVRSAPAALPVRLPVQPDPPAPIVLGCAGIAGIIAASAVPVDRPGIGWLVAGLAGGGVGGGGVAPRRDQPRSGVPSISRQLWVVAALAVLSVGAIRAADWLFALCGLAACAAGSLAVANGRSVRGVIAGVFALPLGAIWALPWVARGLAAVRGRWGNASARLVGSVLLTGVLALVFGALFAGADAAFANLVDQIVPSVDGDSVARWIFVFGAAAAITAGACRVLATPPALDGAGRAGRLPPVRLVEWILPVGVLVAMFATFVLVQAAMLFGGRDYMLRTTGLTAAEYARSGFWQLCAVTVLALVVIGVTARRAPVGTRAERLWLRVLLGALAGLTLVIVASALNRMWAYQDAFGYTVLRVVVAACELWLGVVYLMVLVAVLRLRAPWLPRAVVASAVGAVLALAAVNPDAYVAERNVARYEQTGKIDVRYLGTLSADAVPALTRLPDPMRTCALSGPRYRLGAAGGDGWAGWNLARSNSRELLRSTYFLPSPQCP
jgi:hypothetical protein